MTSEVDFCVPEFWELSEKLGTNLEEGLTESEAQSRFAKNGPNELPEEERPSILKLFIEQFDDTLVRILLFAAIVSAVVGLTENHSGWIDTFIEPAVIITVLIVNALISVKQTLSAEEAIAALKEYEPEMAKVLRRPGSALRLIKARELVVGDIVEVRVGDRVPADLRVCEIYSSVLMADQSILTGESLNVMKIGDPVKIPNPVNQDKINILFSGTNIVSGRAKCIVVSTGVSTEIGKIREHLSQTQTTKTPLQVKLDEFGNQLSFLITIICVLVWVINIHHFDDSFHGNSWIRGAIYYFKIAISLAVAAIPEGLPAVITTCLAIGTRRMAKKNAIVRNLRSVETLGCTSVICSDKTGTITTNQMAVQQLFFPKTNASQVQAIKVSGTTYDFRDGHVTDADVAPKELLEYITYTCCLCSDATISYDEQKKSIHRVGEATEASLLVFAEKLNVFGIDRSSMPISNQIRAVYDEVYKRFKKTFTLEFSRDRKSMSVYCEDRNNKGRYLLFVKGAYEEVISRCTHIYKSTKKVPFDPQDKTSFIQSLKSLCVGRDTLRCIGLAVVEDPEPLETIKKSKVHDFVKFENKMTFLGVCGMMDPPRVEVLDAIKNCANAGIRVIVITGDNKDTAEAICCRVGIFKDGQSTDGLSYSSREFDQLSRKDKLIACSRAQLFSRVEPKHKSEIVGCLQELGEITAMTGDGVNDAPALKKAEIGVAMGSGTAVAKSSADIVLSDDNFSSIIAAVFEGRAIFHNAVQFISYLISSNIGEVVCILVTSLMGLPECLIPVQLLWVNLITDGLPATALGFNPPPSDIMNHPPRDPKKPMIGTWQIIRYCAIGLYVGIVTIIGSLWWYMYDPTGPHLTFSHLMHHQHCGPNEPMYKGIDCQLFNNYIPMSISLSVLVFTEMFNACNSMSDSLSIFSFPPWRNGYLILAIFSSVIIHIGTLAFSATQTLFDVAMLAPHQWKVVMLLSFPVIILDEILKFGYRRVLRKKETLKVKNA